MDHETDNSFFRFLCRTLFIPSNSFMTRPSFVADTMEREKDCFPHVSLVLGFGPYSCLTFLPFCYRESFTPFPYVAFPDSVCVYLCVTVFFSLFLSVSFSLMERVNRFRNEKNDKSSGRERERKSQARKRRKKRKETREKIR